MSRPESLNSAYLDRDKYPNGDSINAAKEILGVCGSEDDRRVKHDTTPLELARQLEAFLRNSKLQEKTTL